VTVELHAILCVFLNTLVAEETCSKEKEADRFEFTDFTPTGSRRITSFGHVLPVCILQTELCRNISTRFGYEACTVMGQFLDLARVDLIVA